MTEIFFADTTIRDGPQSLWANNMRTGMMLAVAPLLDRAGFQSIEVNYAHPRKIVRELKEDPWERLRLLRQAMPSTPLRMIVGRFPRFDVAPPVLQEIQFGCVARIGIRQARMSDEWNQVEEWERKVRQLRAVGLDPVINIIFSESPKHTDTYYAERTRQAASLDCYRLCLKDPGGLLTPARIRTLVPTILANAGDKVLELHSHCTTGLGPWNALEAAKCGLRVLNTGVPPLANGSALPSVFNVAANLQALGFTPVVDEAVLREASERLAAIAERAGFAPGRPVEYDVSQYHHQVPGGMISNLRHQLKLVGMEHRLDETLEECARVREEWGWPIMVTPLSQFVGTQAGINVIVGERYKEVSDQTILYALGYWGGQEAIQAMDPAVRDRVLNRGRARELAAWEAPNPTADEIRQRYGGPGVSDEELLLRYELSEAELSALRAAPRPRAEDYLDADQPLVELVRKLAGRSDRSFVQVEKDGVTLTLQRRGPSG
jgi:oxaloacetate decarboxylase alpha subunit